jgi:hypothetical protein
VEIGADKRLRQQFQQRHAEQRADRVADEPRDKPRSSAFRKKEQTGGDDQSPEPAEQAETDRSRGQRHATFYCGMRNAE